MGPQGFHRKLTAILSADVAGYSRLMQNDEAATVKTLEIYKQVIADLVRQHRGRVVDSPGDNLLSEFASVVDAVQCAVAVQKELQARNAELPENRRMQFRIGVNLGDVIEEGSRIYGDGVNIAARLESLADPGGICISKTAFDQIESKLPFGYESLGEQTVKNIAKPVGAYKIRMEPRITTPAEPTAPLKPIPPKSQRLKFVWATALALLIGAVALWQFAPPKLLPEAKKVDLRKVAFAPPDKTSIAVLPFRNMTGDPQQEYFSDGMTDQLIAGLSQGPDIFITARGSSSPYKGQPIALQQIAAELKVRYLLTGSIQRDAGRVRISVQLIDGKNANLVWAESYDSEYEDLFALQDQITMEVLSFLNVKFTGYSASSLKQSRPTNLKAYEYYLKGLYLHLGRKPQDVPLARQMFEEAINLDPDFGAAYRWLTMVYLDEIIFRITKTPERSLELAERTAQQALAADPDHPPYGQWSAICRRKKDYENAIIYAEKLLELRPNEPLAYFNLGASLMLGERYEEAAVAYDTALRLSPIRPWYWTFNLAWSYMGNKQYDKAILLLNETIEKNPDYLSAYEGLTSAYQLSGNPEKANWAAENVMRINPKFSVQTEERKWPFKDEAFKKRHFDALRSAGLK